MDKEKILSELEKHQWYHVIDLGDGISTPGQTLWSPLWEQIRRVRTRLDYQGKKVLDIGSFDGMWAFEAESLGAAEIVATDCCNEQLHNFLFCKQILGSKVLPYYNVAPHQLFDRLDVYFQENFHDEDDHERLFDIVQHLGVLYHQRDPLMSLSQARNCMKLGGKLLLETACIISEEGFMLFNGTPPADEKWLSCAMKFGDHNAKTYRIGPDLSVWWAPTLQCLKEMLTASLFEPDTDSLQFIEAGGKYNNMLKGRMCMIATAVGPESLQPNYKKELRRSYRNPGLNKHLLA